MRTEAEVNSAIDCWGDTVLRLSLVYVKNYADAEDIFQTVFLKYTLSTQVFESPEHEKAWLIRVTANACKDLLKSFFRRHTTSLEDWGACAGEPDSRRYMVMEAVWSLPRQYREVVYLHYYEGYTAPEIGALLRKNPNTVYTLLRRAREMLKEILGGEADG